MVLVVPLGGPEVATWAIMGVIWEIFVSYNEGLGEAAANRVSFHLIEGCPRYALILTKKIIFVTVVLTLFTSSLFITIGPNVAVAITNEPTLQHLLLSIVCMTGLANAAMAFAQMNWSLAGAQGRFNVASLTVILSRWLITIPLALISIYGFQYDLRGVAAAVAIGHTVSATLLSYKVFGSDWGEIVKELREPLPVMYDDNMNHNGVFEADNDSDDEDDESEYSSSEYDSSDDDEDDDDGDYSSASSSDEEYNGNYQSAMV